jgi:hypothetical protein
VICFDVFDFLALKSLEGISLNKSRFLQEEHARLRQEAVAQRRIRELARELEAARVSELFERDCTTVFEQELAMARSALNTEQLALGVERAPRALAEGQAQSKRQ